MSRLFLEKTNYKYPNVVISYLLKWWNFSTCGFAAGTSSTEIQHEKSRAN